MNTENYEWLSSVANDNGLKVVETTEGSNGYPLRTSYAIIGFTDMEQFNKVKAELMAGCDDAIEEVALHKREGWHFYERNGSIVKPFDMVDEYEKQNYRVYTKSVLTEEAFIKLEVGDFIIDMLNEGCTFADIEKIVNSNKAIWEGIEKLEDNEILLVSEDENLITVEKESMSFYYDTHHYANALTIC